MKIWSVRKLFLADESSIELEPTEEMSNDTFIMRIKLDKDMLHSYLTIIEAECLVQELKEYIEKVKEK